MTLASLLIHTCTIQRDQTPARDSFGAENPVFADLHTDLACRLMTASARVASPSEGFMQITVYKLVIPAKTDVTTKDQVSLVTLEDKSTEGPFDILAVIPRRDGRAQRLVALDLDRVA